MKNQKILPGLAPISPDHGSIKTVKVDRITKFIQAMNGVVADLYREHARMQKYYRDKDIIDKSCQAVQTPQFNFEEKVRLEPDYSYCIQYRLIINDFSLIPYLTLLIISKNH